MQQLTPLINEVMKSVISTAASLCEVIVASISMKLLGMKIILFWYELHTVVFAAMVTHIQSVTYTKYM